jgi:hypothetical protein
MKRSNPGLSVALVGFTALLFITSTFAATSDAALATSVSSDESPKPAIPSERTSGQSTDPVVSAQQLYVACAVKNHGDLDACKDQLEAMQREANTLSSH